MWREAGLLLLALTAVLALRGVGGRTRRLLLVSGALLTATGTALLGHPGGTHLTDGVGVTRLLATAVHILAVTTWGGGVLCLAVLPAPALYGDRNPVVALRTALRAFAVPAALCLSVTIVTGVYLAGSVVVSVDALVATTSTCRDEGSASKPC